MHLVAVSKLREFWTRHPASEQPLRAWVHEVRNAAWTRSSDVKDIYGNASILQSRRVVFNIKGNDYRLVVAIAYQTGWVYVKFVGTHAEYDLINANTV